MGLGCGISRGHLPIRVTINSLGLRRLRASWLLSYARSLSHGYTGFSAGVAGRGSV